MLVIKLCANLNTHTHTHTLMPAQYTLNTRPHAPSRPLSKAKTFTCPKQPHLSLFFFQSSGGSFLSFRDFSPAANPPIVSFRVAAW